jgi:hypothetical protein
MTIFLNLFFSNRYRYTFIDVAQLTGTSWQGFELGATLQQSDVRTNHFKAASVLAYWFVRQMGDFPVEYIVYIC